MPLNATYEFFKAEEELAKAKTREQKIFALEEMIRTCPKHKSAENMLSDLKSKLAKLKKTVPKKAGGRITTIPREGDAQICILGLTQSGKSTLLSKLTNAKPKISSVPYTTTKPEIGTIDYHGVKIQIIEIPSTFESVHMNVAQGSNGIIALYNKKSELEELQKIIAKFRIRAPSIKIQRNTNISTIREDTWNLLGMIKIFTKQPGKPAEKKPLVLWKGANVGDAAKDLHKDFYDFFKFARVWGKSKYPGQVVGLNYKLSDEDTVEIHIKTKSSF